MSIPSEPVQEGGRWRFHRPSGKEVADWFSRTTIHGDLSHDAYVGGVVIIPAQEKVKRQVEKADGTPSVTEAHEMTFTPYVRVDTRVAYAYDYAEISDLVFAKEPVGGGADGLPPGFWWFTPRNGQSVVPYLCCTMRTAFYREEDWFNGPRTNDDAPLGARPLRWGTATKQVPLLSWSKVDDNLLAKAETGAVGRALGMAGILVVGTGIATAEDMTELRGEAEGSTVELPAEAESPDEVRERLATLSSDLRTRHPDAWATFAAWWSERQKKEGWNSPEDAPIEVRRGMVKRIETMLVEAQADSTPSPSDSTPSPSTDDATGVASTQ